MGRISIIRECLAQAFAPDKLEIIDDSDQHKGHEGSRGGAGHYTIVISAACFTGKSRVEAHRMVYKSLADLIPGEIHALRIKIQ